MLGEPGSGQPGSPFLAELVAGDIGVEKRKAQELPDRMWRASIIEERGAAL